MKLATVFVDIVGRNMLGPTLGSVQAGLGAFAARMAGISNVPLMAGGAAAIGAVAVAMGKSISSAVQMESALTRLDKATDLDPAGFEKLKNELFGLSTEMKGVKLDDLISMATVGAKLGVPAAQLGEYARGIAMVSAAMDTIPAEVIATEIGKMNSVFGLGVRGTMQFGSAIDKVDDSSNASAADIMNVTQRISGAAKAAGISAQEAIGMAGALLDTGSHAELAAGALQRLFQVIQTSKGQAGMAAVLGKDAKEMSQLIKDDPAAAIQLFLEKLRALDAMSQTKALKTIGIDAIRGGAEIQKLAQVTGNVARFTGYANEEFVTLNQLTMSYNKQADDSGSILDQVGNKFQILAVTIGNSLKPAFDATLGMLGNFATNATASFQSFTSAASAAIQGTILPGFQAIGARLAEFPAAFAAALGPEAMAMISGLGAAIMGGLSAAFDWLMSTIDGIGLAWRNLPAIFDVAALMIQERIINIGEYFAVLPANLAIIGEYIANNWSNLILDGLNAVGAGFQNLIANIGDFGSAIIAFLQDPTKGFQFNWTPMLQGFQATAAALPELIKPHLTSLQGEIDAKLAEIGAREAARGTVTGGALIAPGAAPGRTLAETMAEIEKGIPGTETFAGIEKAKKGKDAAGQILTADAFTAAATKASVGAGGGIAEKQLKEAQAQSEKLDLIKAAIEKQNRGGVALYTA